MKTTTTVILALLAALTLYSCTADDVDTSSLDTTTEVNVHPDISEGMMQRDTVTKEDDDSEPPIIRPIKP